MLLLVLTTELFTSSFSILSLPLRTVILCFLQWLFVLSLGNSVLFALPSKTTGGWEHLFEIDDCEVLLSQSGALSVEPRDTLIIGFEAREISETVAASIFSSFTDRLDLLFSPENFGSGFSILSGEPIVIC